MKTIFWSILLVCLLVSSSAAQDKFNVTGTPIPKDLLEDNYGKLSKGLAAYDVIICNATEERQSVTSTQIYQSLTRYNPELQPLGRQVILASILRSEKRSIWNILNVSMTTATAVFGLMSNSKDFNVGSGVKTAVALSSLALQQFMTSFQPPLPPDRMQKFDREALEPALVLDGGSCVERTVFAVASNPKQAPSALSFRVQ